MKQSVMSAVQPRLKKKLILFVLFFLCLPVGAFGIWKSDTNVFGKLLYTVLGLPIFIMLYSFLAMVSFAAFLPPWI